MTNERELIEKIFNHIESGDTDKAVFACLRLSKKINDKFNTIIFLRELYPDQKQINKNFYEETNNLTKEAQKLLWDTSAEHWLDERTCRFSIIDDEPEKNILALGVGEMQREIEELSNTISSMTVPNGVSGYDAMELISKYDHTKERLNLRKNAINTILERIKTRCFMYANRVEHQILTQENPASFLHEVQTSVNNYFATNSEDTYRKLQAASNLVNSKKPEDNALLLTSIRRSISSVADHFYPAKPGTHLCSDGKERLLGNEQYLNRLGEFCTSIFNKTTSSDLLKSELSYFMTFAYKLNEIASKGVHSEVSASEAKQGLLGLYLLLSNIIEKIELQPKDQ